MDRSRWSQGHRRWTPWGLGEGEVRGRIGRGRGVEALGSGHLVRVCAVQDPLINSDYVSGFRRESPSDSHVRVTMPR